MSGTGFMKCIPISAPGLCERRELRDRDGRRVGGQDGVRREGVIQLVQHRFLRSRRSRTSTRARTPRNGRPAVALRIRPRTCSARHVQRPLLDQASGLPDRGDAALSGPPRPIHQVDLAARGREDLRDAVPHGAGPITATDASRGNRHYIPPRSGPPVSPPRQSVARPLSSSGPAGRRSTS